jgi:hypothetical protein
MTRFTYLTTALAALLALSAPAALAGAKLNGPALDGRQVALPDRLPVAGAPAADEVRFGGDGVQLNGPALDGRQVWLPTAGAPFEPMAEPPKE